MSIRVKNKVLFTSEPSNSLIKCLIKQRSTHDFCDVIIVVNGRRFYAHKAVLACRSPYFRSMFLTNMLEERCKEIDMTHSVMLERTDSLNGVIDYMYSGEIYIDLENSVDILRIADFLLMDELKEFVKEFFLLHGHLNAKNAIVLWEASKQFNCDDLKYVSTALLKARYQDLFVHSTDIIDIPEEVMFKFIGNEEISTFSNTKDCIHMLMRWLRHNRCHGKNIAPLLNKFDLTALEILTLEELKFMVKDINCVDSLCIVKKALQTKLTSQHVAPKHDYKRDLQSNTSQKILFAVNSHVSKRHLKIILFSIADRCWYNLPFNWEKILQKVPPRLNVCSINFSGSRLYMFLGLNVPYPTDMVKIYILSVDIHTGIPCVQAFRHRYNQTECCQTTLTDLCSVPPAIYYCNGYLCIIGNMRGIGQVFVCDVATHTYLCYQIPNTRFISLARVVARDDKQLFIWSRHRFGHEEYCVNKEVSFSRFDLRTKSFNYVDIPPPPGIDYTNFAKEHVLCTENNQVVVHSPGSISYVLNETLSVWKTHSKKMESFPKLKMPVVMPYEGNEVYAYSDEKLFLLENPSAYITTATMQTTGGKLETLRPPPTDGISLVTCGTIDQAVWKRLVKISHFDELFTQKLFHHSTRFEYDTEVSTDSQQSDGMIRSLTELDSGEDELEYDGFVYDEDVYGLYEEY